MILKNQEIYTYATKIAEAFDENQVLPIKINFYLQKNKQKLTELAQQIEMSRLDIAKNYGKFNEEVQQYAIDPENVEIVKKELDDLFNLEQDVEIYEIELDSLDDSLSLTTTQMEALMFMIK